MTKGIEFLVPKGKTVNLNKMVDSIFDVPWKTSKSKTVHKENSKIWEAQNNSKTCWEYKQGANSNELIKIKVGDFENLPSKYNKAARYIKRKIWERGIQNANVYISYNTLIKISDKLTISDSMGSDQIVSECRVDRIFDKISSNTSVTSPHKEDKKVNLKM